MQHWRVEDVADALRGGERTTEGGVGARAAVSLILRDDGAGVELLFILRAEHPDDPWSGQMGFPGGRAEPGDAGLLDTAIRETAEELGIDLAACAEPLGELDDVRAIARGRPVDLAIRPFVFHLREQVVPRPALSEVREVVWARLDDLAGDALRSTLDYGHDGATLRLPCFRLDGRVIWGLSYRMVVDLQGRLERIAAARV
jgi:8-oxo-dGTP pyrophosphatase MutT (NUDIX family)